MYEYRTLVYNCVVNNCGIDIVFDAYGIINIKQTSVDDTSILSSAYIIKVFTDIFGKEKIHDILEILTNIDSNDDEKRQVRSTDFIYTYYWDKFCNALYDLCPVFNPEQFDDQNKLTIIDKQIIIDAMISIRKFMQEKYDIYIFKEGGSRTKRAFKNYIKT